MQPENPYAVTETLAPRAAKEAGSQLLTPMVLAELSGTEPWVRLLSLLASAGCLGLLLAGFVLLNRGSGHGSFSTFAQGALVLFLGIVLLYPTTHLHRYANRIADLRRTHSIGDLELALAHQRLVWKFTGMLPAVLILGLIVTLLGVLIFGAGFMWWGLAAASAG